MYKCSEFHPAGEVKAKVLTYAASKGKSPLRPSLQASDGLWVTVTGAVCGKHLRHVDYRRRVPVETLTGSAEADLDAVLRHYEQEAAEDRARRERMDREWTQSRTKELTYTFTVRRESPDEWVIYCVERRAPVTGVRLDRSGGVATVSTSDYMVGGAGRGNPAWVSTMVAVLMEANAAAELCNLNRAAG